MEKLESTRQEYHVKKKQNQKLRQLLHQSEEELREVRANMAEQNRMASEMVSPHVLPSTSAIGTGQGHERMLQETQAYLDSLLSHMPDETGIEGIKDELAKRLRLFQKRPVTTGMLQKEPNCT